MMRRLFVISVLFALCACTKVKTDCNYVIVPHIQVEKNSAETTPQGLVAYARYGSAERWTVASYADASQGIFSDTESAEQRSYSLSSVQDQDGNIVFRFTSSPLVLVVVDPTYGIYAWRSVTLTDNLWNLIVPVRFRPWRTDYTYTESKWTVVNEANAPES